MQEPAHTSAYSTPEILVVAHIAAATCGIAWYFGGMRAGGEWLVAALCLPSPVLLVREALRRRATGDRQGLLRMARWCAAPLLLTLWVLTGILNPSHRATSIQGLEILRPVPHVEWLPASADSSGGALALATLGLPLLTGLSGAFCLHSRRALRLLVMLIGANAAVLAVFGTMQKQTEAKGIYFGAFPAANERWFASFHYYNHWGAYAVLCLTAVCGLIFATSRRDRRSRDSRPALAIAAMLVAAAAPMSGSRSASVLAAIIVAIAIVRVFIYLRRRHSLADGGYRACLPALLVCATLAAGGALVIKQSGRHIAERVAQTRGQFAGFLSGEHGYGRPELYADTWRMAMDKPWTGWGLESYGRIFLGYSTFRPGSDGLMNTYVEAHSDWLQSIAEIGFGGTALLLCCAIVPLIETLQRGRLDESSRWWLGGCALVALYAAVEFPLACPAVVCVWWVLWFAALRNTQLATGRAYA